MEVEASLEEGFLAFPGSLADYLLFTHSSSVDLFMELSFSRLTFPGEANGDSPNSNL
jgi:hypothetical protein